MKSKVALGTVKRREEEGGTQRENNILFIQVFKHFYMKNVKDKDRSAVH